ncbi:hypothetical protein BAKON_181 [Buchnera aphidicola str. Ak (Acyrthosiphon kondoi)]|uniref:DUF2076 domain-containing protein n=1 Tax=Buchnera aphidicola str. Ak (Acyrthosiphon kondoi) TaxID=1005090 RepID=G2LMQ1_9GAMM|nr:DUF2076 domain-containing protein [Buchnera aphidicola]AEO08539.1 hypothetical protein BAKON_181 [Buchnera aphidicola str. Ak (Acyrthosiphon kondoi)]
MKDEEKSLIENLFHRLKKIESSSSERDSSANELIQNLTKKQPSSSYYMVQTILIQETAIKKMSMQIEELKARIKMLNGEDINKKPSFLSSFFKKNSTLHTGSNNSNLWKKKEDILPPNYANTTILPTNQVLPTANNNRSSSFLSNALQTATGVAGGMILGNMLMNVFSHTKPEEEIFDTVNKSSSDQHIQDNFSNNNHSNNDLIDYQYNESDIDRNELGLESINNDVYDGDDINIDDDNFI